MNRLTSAGSASTTPKVPRAVRSDRVGVDGKFFDVAGERFSFRGVSYGTFRPRFDGVRLPGRAQMKADLSDIATAGFTIVRTYTEPSLDLIELADEWDLRLLAGIHFEDWRYLVGGSARQRRSLLRTARQELREATERLARNPAIAAVCVANEVPADVVRWLGTKTISHAEKDLR